MFANEMETIERSLKEMKEIESAFRAQPIASINPWAKSRLVDCQSQWEKLSKQVSSHALLLLTCYCSCVVLWHWEDDGEVKQRICGMSMLYLFHYQCLKSNLAQGSLQKCKNTGGQLCSSSFV